MVRKEWFENLLDRLMKSENEATEADERQIMCLIIQTLKENVGLEN